VARSPPPNAITQKSVDKRDISDRLLVDYANEQGREFKIINIVTGEKVDLSNYSFADHRATLTKASRMVITDKDSDDDLFSISNCTC